MTGSVSLLYFAKVRESIGRASETLPLPDGVATVGALARWLTEQEPGYAAAFAAADTIRCAVNQLLATPATPIAAGDEIAFFPPFNGG